MRTTTFSHSARCNAKLRNVFKLSVTQVKKKNKKYTVNIYISFIFCVKKKLVNVRESVCIRERSITNDFIRDTTCDIFPICNSQILRFAKTSKSKKQDTQNIFIEWLLIKVKTYMRKLGRNATKTRIKNAVKLCYLYYTIVGYILYQHEEGKVTLERFNCE